MVVARDSENSRNGKPARLDLPFTRRRRDVVSSVYRHRAGIFAMVAMAFLVAILFIGAKIVLRPPEPVGAMLVDLRTEEELREEVRRLQREVDLRRELSGGGPVSNAVSNAGAEFDDTRSGSSGSGAADDAQGRMDANRDAWEKGMREIDEIGAERSGGKEDGEAKDSRARGTVLVEFSLVNPLRSAGHLVKPGYRCEKDGRVVVDVTVDRGGDVVAAEVNEAASTGDDCMHSTALDAARRSSFNIDPRAPERHRGTITYIFVAQAQ